MARRKRFKTPIVVTVAAMAPGYLVACGGSTADDTGTGGTGTGASGGTTSGGSGGTTSGGGKGGTGATGATGATGGVGASGGAGGTGNTGGEAATGGLGGIAGYGATGGIAGSGALGGQAGTGGTGGVIGDAGVCPATPPTYPFEQCAPEGKACTYELPCQSGKLTFTFSCSSIGYWVLGTSPGSCASHPYDSCPNTSLYCDPVYGWSMPQGTNPPSPCPNTTPSAGSTCFSGGFGGVHENCGYPCGSAGQGWVVANCAYPATQWSIGTCTGG